MTTPMKGKARPWNTVVLHPGAQAGDMALQSSGTQGRGWGTPKNSPGKPPEVGGRASPTVTNFSAAVGAWSRGPPPGGAGRAAPAGAWGRGAPPGLRPTAQLAAAAPSPRIRTPRPQHEAPPARLDFARESSPPIGQLNLSPKSASGVGPQPRAGEPTDISRPREKLVPEELREAFNEIFGGRPPALRERQTPGVEGRPIDLCLNMFNVKLPDGLVYHHDVEIHSIQSYTSPDSDEPVEKRTRCTARVVNRKVIDSFSRLYRGELDNAMLAFDGNKNLYTRRRLKGLEELNDHLYNNVVIEEGDERRTFVVRLRLVATISFDHLNAVYEANKVGFENFQDAVQAADVVLRTGPALRFVPVGRSFFSPPKPNIDGDCALGGSREVWFGFYTSIRLGRWKPVVNIDMSATAFHVAGPLLDLVADVLGLRDKRDLSQCELSDKDRMAVSREIKALKVTATHIESSRMRQQRIEGLTRRGANQESFQREGQQVTVSQYFLKKYSIRLRFPHLPCVQIGKKRTMLPMELCVIAPGQHCKKKLNELQTSRMIRKTALTPAERFDRIKNSVRDLEHSSRQLLREFDMKLETTPIEIKGRVLPAPKVKYAGGRMQQVTNGTWNTDVFHRAVDVKRWAIVNLGKNTNEKLSAMVRHFQVEGRKLGLSIEQPSYVGQYGNRADVRKVLGDVKDKVPGVDITVVVLDPRSPYALIKAEAETTDLCMRTQCVKHSNVETKMSSMFASNLLQKINTKLGGQNNGVGVNVLECFKEPFMVVGMDVNHPALNDKETPSVAAMVASLDSVPFQYHACTSVQFNSRNRNQEYIVETESMFLECVSVFRKRTNVLPKSIYIFRDGISEQQFSAVRMYELGAIRKACLAIDPNFTPYVTFIVVQKRHHVRMKPKFNRDGVGRAGNVPPGTIVDSDIVHPEIFDFYLCSQQGIQGTSRPAHYHVVHDDKGHTPDEIYRLCYYLCHVYARCTRSVSIPAPAYYAHLAAFRAKEHLKLAQQVGSEASGSSSETSSVNSEVLRRYQDAQRVNPAMRSTMYFV